MPEEAARNERWLERFHSEVRIARQISHPNICRVYDIGEFEGTPFISMEYVDGDDLGALLGSIGRLPSDKALETARKLCAGLAAAHDKGVIHRDLKPQNIMMSKRGEIVIMDFGLAAVADSLGGPEARNGTPAYMAPEQLRGSEVTAKSDIYALGLVLYEIFTGKKPYEAKSIPELIQLQESTNHSSLSMTSISADIDPAVEKIIKRCLHPDPAMRPSSPLAIAAALPGGDPLAAALAAGETISPELLAASGKREPVPFKYTFPALLAVAAVIIAVPIVGQKIYAINYAPTIMPPEVLAQKARDNAAILGYAEPPLDSNHSLRYPAGYYGWLQRLNEKGKADWHSAFASEAAYQLRYRQSPRLLMALPDGRVGDSRPASDVSGMWTMDVDAYGRLRHFEAVPPQLVKSLQSPVAVDPVPAFRAAGLDLAQFAEASPQWTPAHPFDHRRAWKGRHPGFPSMDLTVTLASFQGRVVDFRMDWPWSEPDRMGPDKQARTRFNGEMVNLFFRASGLMACIWFASRNLRFRRGDKRGALRIAVAYFLFQIARIPGTFHLVPDPAVANILLFHIADAFFYAALVWLLYVALEPIVRARWPHSIIAWSKAISGQFTDPLLGSHVLYGSLAGCVMAALFLGIQWFDVYEGGRPMQVGLDAAMGIREWFAFMFRNLANGMTNGMTTMFLMFGLRHIFRKDWLCATAASVMFTLLQSRNFDGFGWLPLLLWFAVYCAMMFALMRFGMLAAAVAVFTANMLLNNSACADPRIWYSLPGYLQLVAIAAVASFGFWASRGDHTIDPTGLSA